MDVPYGNKMIPKRQESYLCKRRISIVSIFIDISSAMFWKKTDNKRLEDDGDRDIDDENEDYDEDEEELLRKKDDNNPFKATSASTQKRGRGE